MYACILIVWTGVDAVLFCGSQVCPACCLHVGSQEHGCVDPEDEPAQGLDIGAGLANFVVVTVSGHAGVFP